MIRLVKTFFAFVSTIGSLLNGSDENILDHNDEPIQTPY